MHKQETGPERITESKSSVTKGPTRANRYKTQRGSPPNLKLDEGQKRMLAEATNLPLRIQLGWLDSHGVSIEKIAAHCNCSVEQVQGLKSGKWREPASLRMEYKILELVGIAYTKSEDGSEKGPLRRWGATSQVQRVPRPTFMPKQPAKDPYSVTAILSFYKHIGFTQNMICGIAGINGREFERALFGYSSTSCRRSITNSLDRYQDFLFQ